MAPPVAPPSMVASSAAVASGSSPTRDIAKASISIHEMERIYGILGSRMPAKKNTSIPLVLGRVLSEVPYNENAALASQYLAMDKSKLSIKANSPKKGLRTILRIEIQYVLGKAEHIANEHGIGRKTRGCFVDYESVTDPKLTCSHLRLSTPVVIELPMTKRLTAMDFETDMIALCMTKLSRDGHNSDAFIHAFNEPVSTPRILIKAPALFKGQSSNKYRNCTK